MGMMRNSALGLVVAGSVVLSGCGDDQSENGDPMETGQVETGPVECAMLTLPETAHLEQVEIASEPPSGRGGALKDGDYELVEHVSYQTEPADDEPTWMRAAVRLRRGATVMDYVYDEGSPEEPPQPNGFTALVSTNANFLTLNMLCPAGRTSALGYTASGDSLSIIEHEEEMRFERR